MITPSHVVATASRSTDVSPIPNVVTEGHDLALFGDLILHDTFQVLKSEVEREYLVYLFQKIILCCKEVTQNGKAKVSKSNSVIRKSASSSAPGTGGAGSSQVGRKETPLQLKGRIFINNVISATPSTARPSTSLAYSTPS